MMMRGIFPALLILAANCGAAFAAGEEPQKLGSFKDWQAFTYKAPDSKVCFAFSEPKSSKSSREAKRGPIRFIVTNYPSRKVAGQISTIIGYPFKEGTQVKLEIDDKSFTLFPVGDTAWAEKEDAAIVEAMTTTPARVWRLPVGALAVGQPASLLVVDADPTIDPSTLTRPRAVWMDGALQ